MKAAVRVAAERSLPRVRGFQPFDLDEMVRSASRRRDDHRGNPRFKAIGEPRYLEAMALPPEASRARENAARWFRGEVVSVTTGQQPGYCGGPFLLLLKIATTIALARRLTARGVETIPVFWNAGDDTDFDEMNQAHLATGRLTLMKRVLDPALNGPGRVVGSLPLEDVRPRLIQFFESSGEAANLGEFGRHLGYTDSLWEGSATTATDLGSLQAQFLARLFAADGLVVVDARSPALRVAARPFFERYLASYVATREALAARAAEILAAGGERVLDEGALAWGLFRREGDTRTRIDDRDRLGEAARLLALDPPALSPNVVLRPVLEDDLFPHIGRVVGPAEMLYHDELAPAYGTLGVERARPMARLAATHLPREAVKIAGHEPQGAAALWEDLDGVLGRTAARESPMPETRAALAALRRDWERGVAGVRSTLGDAGANWSGELDRGAGKIDYELRRLEESLDDQNRRALYKREPRLRELKGYLFPRAMPQERRLSLSSVVSLWGEGTPRLLIELAERHLDALAGGSWMHYGITDDEG